MNDVDRDPTFFEWPSPAKLNLFLHITSKRADGYHNLQSLFQLLDSGDTLAFRVRDDGKINLLTDITGVPYEDNLIVKAAKKLQAHSGTSLGCDIKINKCLPMGGGIGGGSSNAATTLVALSAMWSLNVSPADLMQLGLQLGADVPVFINGRTAFASGVGEHLETIELEEKIYLVVNPGVHVSTAMMFSHPELPRNTPEISWSDYRFEDTHNDFQAIACDLFPDIANALRWLLQYAPSRMTGTGASLFGIFDDIHSARKVWQMLPPYITGFIATGCNTSPLLTRLEHYRLNKSDTTKHF